MAALGLPAQRCGRLRTALLAGIASAALLASVGAARAQNLTNTTPFATSTPYTGNVLSNTSTINNNTAGGYWLGTVVTNAGTINNNTGATWQGGVLSNTNTLSNYGIWLDGDITSNSGTLTNYAGASWAGDVTNSGEFNNFGAWEGDVIGNYGSNRIENRAGATWVGDIILNHDVITNFATWTGDILGNGGDGHDYVDNLGNWYGDVYANAGTVYNTKGVWTGDIYGNSNTVVNNFVTPSNGSLWVGDVLGNSWLIMNYTNGTWQGDVVDNPGDLANYGHWIGDATNRGRMINTGVWTGDIVHTGTFFWARNQIDGRLDNRGRVQLTGDLSVTTLVNTGRLELTHDSGLQTLSAGTVALGSGSSFEINVNAAGGNDKMVVSGAASLGGTVRVLAATGGAPYASPTRYTILTAASISGSFAGASTDLAFFAANVSNDANAAYVTLKRNDLGFGETGATGNQMGVGATVEALGAGNPLYDAVLWLTPEQAQDAFDQLSGESYGSEAGAAVQGAGLVGGLATSRVDQAFAALGDTSDAASGYAGDVLPGEPVGDRGLWAQFYGGAVDSSEGGSALRGYSGGLVAGLDGMLAEWRLGAMLQIGATGSTVASRNASTTSTDYGLGVYAGTQWGATQLALGGTYTAHDTQSRRDVAFPGFTDSLSAHYLAGTAQAFAELSHAFDLGTVTLTPYAGLAQVRYATPGFSETGGAAALTRSASVIDATFVTLGLGLDRGFVVGGDMLLTVHGSLGWRHAFSTASDVTSAFATGTAFSVAGTPMASDLALLDAGFSLDVDATTNLDLSYAGQLGAATRTHALKGTWATRF